MALKMSIAFDEGFTSANGYVKINRIRGDKDNIRFDTQVFYSKTARDAGKPSLANGSYEITMPAATGNDLFVDLYNHLKTLPEFAGAVDA